METMNMREDTTTEVQKPDFLDTAISQLCPTSVQNQQKDFPQVKFWLKTHWGIYHASQ